MGLFGRKKDPDEELARAIGTRGLAARAAIESVWATGETRDGAQRLELTLSFTTREGTPVKALARQWVNEVSARGLEAGRAAEIMYDREAPATVVVLDPAA